MADNMIPDYEVKALLDSSIVLGADKKLSSEFISKFNVTTEPRLIKIQYLETNDKDFNAEGWINRIRIKDGKTSFELTYKKRYRVENGDIKAALDLANEKGFDINETSYEPQVDWGYNQMTLSMSNNKSTKNTGYDALELPDQNATIGFLLDKIPGKLDKWVKKNWGTETMQRSRIYGPVLCSKYKGLFEDKEIDIEVWPIKAENGIDTEYITELSFKEDEYLVAQDLRARIYAFLDEEGILLHKDSLKTQMVLNRY